MNYGQRVKIKATGEVTVVKFVIKQNGEVMAVYVYNYETRKTDRYDIDEVELCG